MGWDGFIMLRGDTMNEEMPAGWVTTTEGAALTGYTREHVIRLARWGRIDGRKLAGLAWIVNRDSLLAYKASNPRPGVKAGSKRKTRGAQ